MKCSAKALQMTGKSEKQNDAEKNSKIFEKRMNGKYLHILCLKEKE